MLADRDAITVDAVIDDIRAGAANDWLEADESAAMTSDITSVPSFVLFRDDTYVTTVVGPHNVEVFKGALDTQ